MVMPAEQRLLQAGRSLWNLRQFDLARSAPAARARCATGCARR